MLRASVPSYVGVSSRADRAETKISFSWHHKIPFYVFSSCQPQVKKHIDPLLEKVLLKIISCLISFGLQYKICEFLTSVANVEGAD